MSEPFRYKPRQGSNTPIDETRCRASVSDGTRTFTFHQCERSAKYGEWCGIHDPAKAAARAAKRPPTRFERRMAAAEKARARLAALEAVADAAKALGIRDVGNGVYTLDLSADLDETTNLQFYSDVIDALGAALARLDQFNPSDLSPLYKTS